MINCVRSTKLDSHKIAWTATLGEERNYNTLKSEVIVRLSWDLMKTCTTHKLVNLVSKSYCSVQML